MAFMQDTHHSVRPCANQQSLSSQAKRPFSELSWFAQVRVTVLPEPFEFEAH